MALLVRLVANTGKKNAMAVLWAQKGRLSTLQSKPTEQDTGIQKSVFISQSEDIFANLALEDWLYRHMNLDRHHVMLLWRNSPCVVIGRHQNPWLEANLDVLERREIPLARRNSGGGTVYHDKGNLNISFFAPRERYNRKQNLQLLAKCLEKEWDLNPMINKREDIIMDSGYKISGTASRLGRPNSYHHCTLLVNVDKKQLSEALHTHGGLEPMERSIKAQAGEDREVITTATQSVPSRTVNLSECHPGVTMDRLITALGWQYLRTGPVSHRDMGWHYVAHNTRGFQLINPTETWFPGLDKIKEELESWDWIYGKTPKFEVRRCLKVDDVGERRLTLSVEVERGLVTEVKLQGAQVGGNFTGARYTEALLASIEEALTARESTAPAPAAAAAAVANA